MKIKKIEIEIGWDNKQKIKLTIEEAKELARFLNDMFEKQTEYIPYFPPYYPPIYPREPMITWSTCDSSGKIKTGTYQNTDCY